MLNEFAVIDFETTGLSGDYDRVIEVAAAIVRDGEVADSFVQLMHPGCRIPFFITDLTGISNEMVRGKPSPEAVMPLLKGFLGDRPCVAHNASFDARFFHAEMSRSNLSHERTFYCTMKLSRRLVHDSPSHKLGTLADHLKLPAPPGGRAHRALYDVLLTVELWKRIRQIIIEKTNGRLPDGPIYQAIMKKSKAAVQKYLNQLADETEKIKLKKK